MSDEIKKAEAARRIWHVLSSHRGQARAITAGEIARRTGIGDEAGTAVRAVMAEALEFFPAPVAASGHGYFVVETPEEAQHYVANLLSRLRLIARRVAVFRRKMEAAGFERQAKRFSPPLRRNTLF